MLEISFNQGRLTVAEKEKKTLSRESNFISLTNFTRLRVTKCSASYAKPFACACCCSWHFSYCAPFRAFINLTSRFDFNFRFRAPFEPVFVRFIFNSKLYRLSWIHENNFFLLCAVLLFSFFFRFLHPTDQWDLIVSPMKYGFVEC